RDAELEEVPPTVVAPRYHQGRRVPIVEPVGDEQVAVVVKLERRVKAFPRPEAIGRTAQEGLVPDEPTVVARIDLDLVQVVCVVGEGGDLERVARIDGDLHFAFGDHGIEAGIEVGAGYQSLGACQVKDGREHSALFESFELWPYLRLAGPRCPPERSGG